MTRVQPNFNDRSKWTVRRSVPVLDEHEALDAHGKRVAFIGRDELQQIAANNNRRARDTGDLTPVIVGHTSDDPTAPEKPAVGFAVNYRVAPYRNGRSAIFVDLAVRKRHERVLEDFPRRSVELWLSKKELDPIALHPANSRYRDAGAVVKNARLKALSLLGGTTPDRDLGMTLTYSRDATLYRCSIPTHHEVDEMFGDYLTDRENFDPPYGPARYGRDDYSDEYDADDTNTDPLVAKVLASKTIKDLMGKVDEMYQALTSSDENGAEFNAQGDEFEQPGGMGDEDEGDEFGGMNGHPPVGFGAPQSAGPGQRQVAPGSPTADIDTARGAGRRPQQQPVARMSRHSDTLNSLTPDLTPSTPMMAATVADALVSGNTPHEVMSYSGYTPDTPAAAVAYADSLARGESEQAAIRYARRASGGPKRYERSSYEATALPNDAGGQFTSHEGVGGFLDAVRAIRDKTGHLPASLPAGGGTEAFADAVRAAGKKTGGKSFRAADANIATPADAVAMADGICRQAKLDSGSLSEADHRKLLAQKLLTRV